jgi:hypothetical protein
MVQRIINFILYPLHKWKENREINRQLEELRKRDPFIYK